MREQQDRFFRMIYKVGREVRLVIQNQRNVVCAGNVFGGDDREFVPGNVAFERDVFDPAARGWAAHRHAVKHVGKRQIIDVKRLTRDFLAAFFAGERFADGMIRHLDS